MVLVDVDEGVLNLEVAPEEMHRRLAAWEAPVPRYKSGVFAKYTRTGGFGFGRRRHLALLVKILFIGDIFANVGRRLVADHLADIREAQGIDLVIANSENSAGGFGVTPGTAEELFALGVDVLTGGNHSFDKREIYDYMAVHPGLLRPANYPPGAPGAGMVTVTARNGVSCAVLNLQGRVYMAQTDCPFRKADELLGSLNRSRSRSLSSTFTRKSPARRWPWGGIWTAVSPPWSAPIRTFRLPIPASFPAEPHTRPTRE